MHEKLGILLAGQDLFSQDWTTGDLTTNWVMEFIVKYLGAAAQMLISVVGFGVVIFSISKNALAGLYAVSQKLWDRVDEIKKANVSAKPAEGGNQLINILGTIPTLICKCLPNIKAMTEFDDEQITPKLYFMKSLPILCVQIFIGAFIFFGYPAQFANKVQLFGRGVIDTVFANVDPLVWIENLPGQLTNYPFVTEDSQYPTYMNINEICHEAAPTFASKYNDMTKNSKIECMLAFEQQALSLFGDNSLVADKIRDRDSWDMSVGITISNQDTGNLALKQVQMSGDGNTCTYIDTISVSSLISGGGEELTTVTTFGSDKFIVRLTFTRKAVDVEQVQSSKASATLYLPNDYLVNGVPDISKLTGLTLKGTVYNQTDSSSTLYFSTDSNGTITIRDGKQMTNGTWTSSSGTATWTDGTHTVAITKIVVGSDKYGVPTFENMDANNNVKSWQLGLWFETTPTTPNTAEPVVDPGNVGI